MSSSTVAITATPAVANGTSLALDNNTKQSARRRTVAITEKKSNIEVATEGGGISGEKDFSHSIRGETVLEKPNELSQSRKAVINSTISPRRRKAVPKPEKPARQVIPRVLAKNLVLLLALTGLGQMIWRWSRDSGDRTVAPVGALDFEGRISEFESFLKKTTKMMQVQVEVVDRKVENEIGSLRKELTKKVDEKGALLENELKKLGDRTDKMDKSLAEFQGSGFLSKSEFEDFLNELKKSKGLEGGEEDLSLDQIRAVAREIVEKEIEKHAADGLGRVDYALASGGARVVSHSEPFHLGKGTSWLPGVKGGNKVHFLAQKMLEPSFGEPGQCLPLKGSSGFVEIRLRTPIIPKAVTLEHVAKSVAYDRSSAPKDCRLSAWYKGHDEVPSDGVDKMPLLAEFTYDLERSNAQTFNVESTDSGVVNMIRLDFTSNHGSPLHTCIYRLRVHGREPESVALLK
ncbi:protein SAD1/UNC-84 domain-containing protein [Cinnamomum micranthum f. kanehirae]|uniref:Protein SAD1/UNC-84 domain-containing protein n=1 Tax=Cinnamomum micranthum f. kanehirae TaxID=337451 RepID=A0A443NML0_9MAGN|nr:protein SAD1/UNC-84 domain-containing protein [Cinnamomum micranthum f. kanehirae]